MAVRRARCSIGAHRCAGAGAGIAVHAPAGDDHPVGAARAAAPLGPRHRGDHPSSRRGRHGTDRRIHAGPARGRAHHHGARGVLAGPLPHLDRLEGCPGPHPPEGTARSDHRVGHHYRGPRRDHPGAGDPPARRLRHTHDATGHPADSGRGTLGGGRGNLRRNPGTGRGPGRARHNRAEHSTAEHSTRAQGFAAHRGGAGADGRLVRRCCVAAARGPALPALRHRAQSAAGLLPQPAVHRGALGCERCRDPAGTRWFHPRLGGGRTAGRPHLRAPRRPLEPARHEPRRRRRLRRDPHPGRHRAAQRGR